MKNIIPKKLQRGDEIRIIAPSWYLPLSKKDKQEIINLFKERGYEVSFSKSFKRNKKDFDSSSSVQDRIDDLHEAFLDRKVVMILCLVGGFNVNQLLPHIDYKLFLQNPKIVCGGSDITALLNALYAKTGIMTFFGPNLRTLGIEKVVSKSEQGLNYRKQLDNFFNYFENKIGFLDTENLFTEKEIGNNENDQENNEKNSEKKIESSQNKIGDISGTIIGGNLCTFNLLQGTEFMPSTSGTITLCVEDNNIFSPPEYFVYEFERNLVTLTQQKWFSKVTCIIIGSLDGEDKKLNKLFKKVIRRISALQNITLVFDARCSHAIPRYIVPIGKIVFGKKKSG